MIQELIIVAALSLIFAFYNNKDISTLDKIRIKGLGFFIFSFILQSGGVYIATRYSDGTLGIFINKYFTWIHCLSYQLILIGIILNLEKKYMKIFFLGTLLNFTVIIFNGMKMPVRLPEGMENVWENLNYLKNNKDLIHILMTKNTRFNFLGDIFLLRKPYPFKKALSIGDVLLLIGFFVMIQEESIKKKYSRG